jgi:hypothetical protein
VAASRDPEFSLQFFKSKLSGGLMYASSLASGWKKKKNIKAKQRGSVGTMMGSVPALIMLGAIACVGISSTTSACSSNVLEELGGAAMVDEVVLTGAAASIRKPNGLGGAAEGSEAKPR